MELDREEEKLLRSVALQNSRAVMVARERAERELIQAKEALQQSNDRVTNILESITDGFLVLDQEWRITYLNRRGEEILRPLYQSKEVLLGQNLWEAFPDTIGTSIEENYRRAKRDQVTVQFESFYPPLNAWFDIRGYPSPVGLSVYFQDVTTRRRAQDELHQQHEWFAVTLASIGDAVITTNVEAKVTFLNPVAEAMTGWKTSEAAGQPLETVFKIVNESTRQPVDNPIAKVLREGVVVGLANHTALIAKDGTETAIEDSAAPIRNDTGEITGAVMVFHDVTERRRTEGALRRSEEEFRALANSIPQLAWMAEPDGHIFWYNNGWFEYTGTTLAEMEGWGWEKVHDPKMLPFVAAKWTESLRTGQPFDMEFPIRGADGVFQWFLTRVNPLRDREGRVVRWFGTNTNVDEVRRTREALREETRVLELLNDTGAAIAAKLDLQSLVQTVTDSATQLTGAKFGAFFYNVLNEQGESFLLYTLSGAPREAFEKFGLPRNTPVFNPTFQGEGVMRSGDITKDPRYGTMSPHHGMPKGHLPVRSYLAVPVISRSGEVLGGLFFGHPEADIFTERSERLAVGVAAQAAVAIDNARLYDAAQKEIAQRKKAEEALAQRVRLTALRAEVSADLARSDDLRVVLKRCTDALVKHVDACFARIWTVNAAENFLELQASSGIYTHLDGPHGRVKMGQFKIGRIAENRRPHLTNDVQNDPNISDPDWARREGMVGFAGYPLMVESRVVGVIALFARQPFTEELLKELLLMADGLAQWIQRKQAEQALHEAQEKLSRHAEDLENQVTERTSALRETIGELEAFSYSISHDMRAPLRAMQSFALILAEDYAPHLDANGKEYIRRITTAAERMDRLIQDVLTYSRIARTDLPLVPIDVEKLIKDILISYPAFQAPAAEIQVEGEFPRVLGLEAVLTQCISNLLGNAVKFVPPGEPPRVRVWAETMPNGETVRILFKDNGVGIEKNAHEQIFVMFQRLSKSYEGTGIGLAIVKKGAERVSGNVGLESEPGRGSTFWLELKRADAPRK